MAIIQEIAFKLNPLYREAEEKGKQRSAFRSEGLLWR